MNKPKTRSVGINTDHDIHMNCKNCAHSGTNQPNIYIVPYMPHHMCPCMCMLYHQMQNNCKEAFDRCNCHQFDCTQLLEQCKLQDCSHRCKPYQQESGYYKNAGNDKMNKVENDVSNTTFIKSAESVQKSCGTSSTHCGRYDLNEMELKLYANEMLKNIENSDVANRTNSNDKETKEKSAEEKKIFFQLLESTKPVQSNHSSINQDESDDSIEFDNMVTRKPEAAVNFETDEPIPSTSGLCGKKIHPPEEDPTLRVRNKNSDVAMLMMLKALVNNQGDSPNNTRLNKLLSHISNETDCE